MGRVNGLVAKDFNFPAAYHRAKGGGADNICALDQDCSESSFFLLDDSVKVRREGEGAVLYTSYHNGFYVNGAGMRILDLCREGMSVREIIEKLSLDCSRVLEFLARALTIGVVQVHAT